MNYKEALKYIRNTEKFGSRLGLERIKKLLELLNNPQDTLKIVHVAGTNGKGSTCVMINKILQHAGYKTGLYISPYIEEFTERIQINGNNIEKDNIANIIGMIKEAIDKMIDEGYENPTEFEIITAAAFVYFSQEKCDLVVLEVGLGGRFDATNVIKSSLVSVITAIGMDHTKQLGSDIVQIAFEKCGIIKESQLVITYPLQDTNALKVIEKACETKKCILHIPDIHKLKIITEKINNSIFSYKDLEDLELSLTGTHQIYNCITAIETVLVLKELYNYKISYSVIKEALKKIKWPGRFEIVSKNPTVIYDGAHNLEAIKGLVTSLKKVSKNKNIIFVISFMQDKNYKECIRELTELDSYIITTAPNNQRAEKPEILKKYVLKYTNNCISVENSEDALRNALNKSDKDDIICCCGSLYLISELKKYKFEY